MRKIGIHGDKDSYREPQIIKEGSDELFNVTEEESKSREREAYDMITKDVE